jgi:hypothetical protein
VLAVGVDGGAHYLYALVQVPAVYQQLGQQHSGVVIADVGYGAQYSPGLVQVGAVFQQPGQLLSGPLLASGGSGAQFVQVASLGQ